MDRNKNLLELSIPGIEKHGELILGQKEAQNGQKKLNLKYLMNIKMMDHFG